MALLTKKTITKLADSTEPIVNSRLTELSNLNSEELELLTSSWGKIETKRRRQIVHRLVELAEDNLELNFDSIFKYSLKDPDDEVRNQAIEGLWENEEASLIDPLINILRQDNSEKVRAAAAIALGKFAMLAVHKKLRSCHLLRIQEALLEAIDNKDSPVEVRRRALEAVAPVSLPRIKTAIIEAYQSHNPRLQISAIHAMGRNCDPSWLPILLKELASVNAEMRYEAAGACGELAEETAVPCLIKLINDPDIDVQIAVIQALGKIGSTEAKECLEQCLDSASEVICQTAEQVLNELEAQEDPMSYRL